MEDFWMFDDEEEEDDLYKNGCVKKWGFVLDSLTFCQYDINIRLNLQ